MVISWYDEISSSYSVLPSFVFTDHVWIILALAAAVLSEKYMKFLVNIFWSPKSKKTAYFLGSITFKKVSWTNFITFGNVGSN